MIQKPKQIIPEKIIGLKTPAIVNSFTDRDAIIYSLGVGFSHGSSELMQTR